MPSPNDPILILAFIAFAYVLWVLALHVIAWKAWWRAWSVVTLITLTLAAIAFLDGVRGAMNETTDQSGGVGVALFLAFIGPLLIVPALTSGGLLYIRRPRTKPAFSFRKASH